MAEIIDVMSDRVKIGKDDDTVVTVPIASLKFANPKVGDKVKIYKDGKGYIVTKASSSADDVVSSLIGDHKFNKHLFVWGFAFLLGGFGVDRFMRGQIALGVLKIFFGWCVWGLVDWIIALNKAYGSGNTSEFLEFDEQGNYIN